MTRKRAYWVCQLGGWVLWATFGLVIHSSLENTPTVSTLLTSFVVTVSLGVGLTHAYRAYLRAHNWTTLPLRALIPRVLLAAVLLSIVWNLTQVGIAKIGLLPQTSVLQKPALVLSALVGGIMLWLTWSTIYFGLHFFWNYRQSEIERLEMAVQSREAKLSALRLQLNPHFLFNSLNSVRALISEDPAQAKTMITRLARLLRKTLQSSKVPTVSLREELRLARTYLELEAVRLEERLQFTIDADPATHEVPVPPLLVQTLVENAVKHGIAERRDGGCVHVTACCNADDMLCVQVRNAGHLEHQTRGGGVGLQNLRERLQLLYGAEATFTLSMEGAETVVAEAWLPPTPVMAQPDADVGASAPLPNADGRAAQAVPDARRRS